MIHALNLIHIKGQFTEHNLSVDPSAFVLQTCQRAIVVQTTPIEVPALVNLDFFEGKEAYEFLLETICGLKSKLLGESEIVSQFKEAFTNYLENQQRSSVILRVLEKLFKDAKQIRREYLLKIGQQSYAGIARRIIQAKVDTDSVLILGSGQLAKDVIKQLEKKYQIYISARNTQKVSEIQNEFSSRNIQAIDWTDKDSYQSFTTIINTIGADYVIFNHDFFKSRKKPSSLFIDLGSPCAIETPLMADDGVFRLSDVFSHGEKLDVEKQNKIDMAKCAIKGVVDKRVQTLGHNYPFSWEELHF
ncbi:glutamyl-tRNAGlu reductase [Bacteriovorax sp. Seq25_V]|uniref:glutamyl-tRNAGlu reductase n=1 Tax=Bacteriovorax sp. Seq25_V TaxID=1201288 RepID=UPI000389F39B|nr:glutamyl-tRNAGlu reductase [Bacteriovorax sp. Seq25_V]EQC46027.1 glutamyl-tRNAGlu reductase, N-terminal-like domain protein [Bacteriovorax sp. Seq25_V]